LQQAMRFERLVEIEHRILRRVCGQSDFCLWD
jgi:hypothetical protein